MVSWFIFENGSYNSFLKTGVIFWRRTANRKVLLDLLKQAKDITMEEDLTDDLKHSLEAIMRNVNEKEK